MKANKLGFHARVEGLSEDSCTPHDQEARESRTAAWHARAAPRRATVSHLILVATNSHLLLLHVHLFPAERFFCSFLLLAFVVVQFLLNPQRLLISQTTARTTTP